MPDDSEPIGELFDARQEYFVVERLRPHWSQAGAIVFITFRTADSVPLEVLNRWDNRATPIDNLEPSKCSND